MAVIPFSKDNHYTDFRVLVRDVLDKYPDSKQGILVIFDEEKGMKIDFVCKTYHLSFAGAALLRESLDKSDQ